LNGQEEEAAEFQWKLEWWWRLVGNNHNLLYFGICYDLAVGASCYACSISYVVGRRLTING
jgi:hypothetical protein